MEIDGLQFTVRAGISETLPVQVLLGTDVPELFKLLCDRVVEPEREDCLAVTTRSQLAQLDQAESGLEFAHSRPEPPSRIVTIEY